MSYFHAGGIDRPLVITKDGQSIIPHQNWRGQFARGTYPNGYKSDCTSYPASGCTPIQWPGERTTPRHELEEDGNIRNWFGGLVDGMRDASGQMYMRNRYYDPATGQFTQPDPIGLAGGLNAYGFAEGDPVSYSDPYGLCGVAGAIAGVVQGAAVGYATGLGYSLRGAAVDAASGALCLGALRRLGAVGRFLGRNGDDAADAGRAVRRGANTSGRLPDDALVCRGGTCTAERFKAGSGVTQDAAGRLEGVSVNSAPGASVAELTQTIPNRQVGVTTVGQVRAAGGDVVPSGRPGNPAHATMSGITPQQAERLFTPTVRNPNVP